MRTLNEILTEINSLIESGMVYSSDTYSSVDYYNEAILQEIDGKTFPIINSGNRQGSKISIIDNSLICYHRVIDSETEVDPKLGYGKYPYRKRIYTIRNVWIGEWKSISTYSYEFNDDVKNDIYSAFPVRLSGKERIFTTNESVNKQTVLDEEFPNYNFKNLNLELIAFYIEYQIHQRINCA